MTTRPFALDINVHRRSHQKQPSTRHHAPAQGGLHTTVTLEISIASFDKVEPGNGGYRFNLTLLATYPDAKRKIPMYCRATPTTLVELKFG